jgi:hypothetical protein
MLYRLAAENFEALARLASVEMCKYFADHIKTSVFTVVGSVGAVFLISMLMPAAQIDVLHELLILFVCGVVGLGLVIIGGFVFFAFKLRNDPRVLATPHTRFRALPALGLVAVAFIAGIAWAAWPAPDLKDRSVPPLVWERIMSQAFTEDDQGNLLASSLQMLAINEGNRQVVFKDAFIRSAITGQRLDMQAGLMGNAPPASEINPIPPGARLDLIARFPGRGLSIRTYILEWSKVIFTAQYDGREYSVSFDLGTEALKAERAHLPKAPDPRVTRRPPEKAN